VTVLSVAALAVPTAFAGHEENPLSGPDHAYGEDVDYPLTFPVAGANRYGDHFWYTRGDRYHHGIDIMAEKMTPVVAATDGVISYYNGSGNQSWVDRYGRCCTLRITADDGWITKYIHLNNDSAGTDDGQGWGISPNIKLGTRVTAGQLIGWVGDSGDAETTPPHLHFELVDPHGVIVDPYLSLRAAETGFAPAICKKSDVGSLTTLLGGTALLKAGSKGTEVAQLQQFLTAIGFQVGAADGVFGPMTTAGVRSFQQNQGLTPDGVVGSQTRSAIGRVAAVLPAAAVLDADGRILRPGARGDDVAQLQEILRLAGHDPGSVDGVFGPMTQAAIESFQAGVGITVDGKIGPTTRAKLSTVLGLVGLQFCDA
jgi:peptidoglycan hydrolase-like protein with peptidoglycan-binding domain